MNEIPKKLGEVMDKDLAGFQQVQAHFLELSHGLMGFFPALVRETEDIVVCLDKKLLIQVMERLPKRKSKFGEFQMLANIDNGYGFEVGNHNGKETKPLRILSEEEFEKRIQEEEKPFKWAPGLVGNDMTEEEFIETLELAKERC
ncbi:hypothetical protein C0583_04510 [Candidatus Parcubacteria bacterium]|nr:MAG: hypothetical protein C0583_04510 [Candidatus Parcubacteria bacterium]